MKKNVLLLLIGLLPFMLYSQLPTGSIAPNFTTTDINGNEHTLYDYLGDGKPVILDVSATWCGPCWTFHNGHSLKNLYETYGPDGTDEVMVFFVEGDPSTTLDNLYGIGATQGDWVTNTPYPIIDDHTIADAFQISYYPTLFIICPNKVVTQIPISGTSPSGEALYLEAMQCSSIDIENEIGLVAIKKPLNKIICGSSISPVIVVENNGSAEITDIHISISIDETEVLEQNWSGSILTFRKDTILIDEIAVEDGNHTLKIEIADANSSADEDLSNNVMTRSFSMNSSGALAEINLFTDNSPLDIRWDIKYNDDVIISAQNFKEPLFLYSDSICLNYSYCYDFTLYDITGDGMEYGALGYAEISFLGGQLLSVTGDEYDESITEYFCLLSPNNDFISFQINGQFDETVYNFETNQILIYLFSNTDVTNLVPDFTISENATAYINDIEQISGVSSVNFTTPVSYKVIADNGNEKIWTVAIQKVSSTEIVQKNETTLVYPNPSNGIFYLKQLDEGKIMIYDYVGKLVFENEINSSNQMMDINHLNQGSYIVHIISKNHTLKNKLTLIK